MADTPNTLEADAARKEAAAKAHKEAQEAATKRLDEEDKARESTNLEIMANRAKGKPTPTQRESDLAKLGLFNPDDREDDGSGPETFPVATRRGIVAEPASRYKTRDINKPTPQ